MPTKSSGDASSPAFSAVDRARLSDQIAGRIQDAITSEQYKPGERLPSEQTLATSFKTSRGTVREALRALQATGFVDIRNGAGAFIASAPFSFGARHDRVSAPPRRREDVLEILEIRTVLQSLAVRRCAQRVNAGELDAFEALLGQLREAAAAGDADRYAALDRQFHFKIAGMCDNPMLRDIVHHVEDVYHAISRALVDLPGRPAQSVEELQQIVDALRENDEAAAELAMQRHLGNVLELVAGLPSGTAALEYDSDEVPDRPDRGPSLPL